MAKKHDRSHLTPEQAIVAAESLRRVGGVYEYIAAVVAYENGLRVEDKEEE